MHNFRFLDELAQVIFLELGIVRVVQDGLNALAVIVKLREEFLEDDFLPFSGRQIQRVGTIGVSKVTIPQESVDDVFGVVFSQQFGPLRQFAGIPVESRHVFFIAGDVAAITLLLQRPI